MTPPRLPLAALRDARSGPPRTGLWLAVHGMGPMPVCPTLGVSAEAGHGVVACTLGTGMDVQQGLHAVPADALAWLPDGGFVLWSDGQEMGRGRVAPPDLPPLAPAEWAAIVRDLDAFERSIAEQDGSDEWAASVRKRLR